MFYSSASFRTRTSLSFTSVHVSLHYIKQVGVLIDSQLVNRDRKEHPSSSNIHNKALVNKYTHFLRITLLWDIVNG